MGESPAETVQSRVTTEPRWIHTLQPGESVSSELGNTMPSGKLVEQSGITGTRAGEIRLHVHFDSVEHQTPIPVFETHAAYA